MKILVAEDSAISRRMLEALLTKWGYEVLPAQDGREAWKILSDEDPPRLAILDWMMPQMDGVEVCKRVRDRGDHPYTYLLLLTSRTEKQDLVCAMDAGADDYLTKPFDPNELQVRLRAGRRILELQEELIAAREALRIQATRDALTGVWNRGAVLDILGKELIRAKRDDAGLCLIMADLDHFKHVNDTYGHPAGDVVLRDAASRMRSVVRPYDSIGRYGGEEFLIIIPGYKGASGLALAERLRAAVGEQAMELPEATIRVTVSLGVAAAECGETAEMESLLRAVDGALYEAKTKGRNRVEMAN